MRRRARNALATEAVEEGEQSFQGEAPPAPLCWRRGRPKAAAAQEVEQEHPPVE